MAAWTQMSCGPHSPKSVCSLPAHSILKRVLMCAFFSQFNPWPGIKLHPSTVIEFISSLTSSPHSNFVNSPIL